MKEKAVLNRQHDRAYKALSLDSKDRKSKGKDKADEDRKLTQWMCANFYDIRAFGAVMTTEVNCGQVRGPIQFTLARSIDPIITQEHSITRCAVATEREAEKQEGDNRTMGRKFTVPYGLYRGFGYINASLADPQHNGTDFSEEDLALFKKSLSGMFENDRSAARGRMSPVRCIAFRHENKLGNARADQLFARVKVELKEELKNEKRPPRSKDDYKITVAAGDLPEGVTVEEWV